MQREGRRTQAERNVSEEHRYTGWPDGYVPHTRCNFESFHPLLLHPFSQLSNLPTRDIYNYHRRNNHQNLNSILLPLFSRGMKRRCFNFNLKKLLTLPSLSLSLSWKRVLIDENTRITLYQRDASRIVNTLYIYIYIMSIYHSSGVHVRRVVYIKHTGERRSWILISLGGLSYLSSPSPRDPARGTVRRVATFGRPFQNQLPEPPSLNLQHTLSRPLYPFAGSTMAGVFTWITRVLFTQVDVFKRDRGEGGGKRGSFLSFLR